MAIAEDGMFGSGRGKVGNLVYYTRRGKPVVRRIGRNTNEPSEAQLANRQQMKIVNAFCKPALPFMNYGFMAQIVGTDLSQFNVGVSYNKKNAVAGVYPEQRMDYPKALLSEGPLLQAEEAAVEIVPEGLKFTWQVSGQLHWPDTTDQAMVIVFFPDGDKPIYKLFGAERSAGNTLLELSAPLLGKYMETYLAFISADRTQVSTSVYVGALNQPAGLQAQDGSGAGEGEAKS